MNATHIVNKLLSSVTENMHKTRLTAVSSCVVSLLSGNSSSVTAIGRGIHSHAQEKHKIKRAGRLCSNHFMQSNLISFYRQLARRFVNSNRPVIHIDWSDLDTSKHNFLIRASVVLDCRPLTIYQEVHSIKTKVKTSNTFNFFNTIKINITSRLLPYYRDRCWI